MNAVELEHASRDEAAKGVTQLLTDVEATDTSTELILGVPCREQVDHTREEDRLTETEDDSDQQESAVGLDGSGAGRNGSPDDSGDADVKSRPRHLGDDKVAWDLERQVTDEEDGHGGSKVRGRHVKVGHDALELGGGQVLPVDVFTRISQSFVIQSRDSQLRM